MKTIVQSPVKLATICLLTFYWGSSLPTLAKDVKNQITCYLPDISWYDWYQCQGKASFIKVACRAQLDCKIP